MADDGPQKPEIIQFPKGESRKDQALAMLAELINSIESDDMDNDEHLIVIYHQADSYAMILGLTDISEDSLIAATSTVAKDVLLGCYDPEIYELEE